MIDVLLASYHPDAVVLRSQVDSIVGQRDVEANLMCREDAAHEGACANFAVLLMESRSDYVAYSDQDDVWLPGKLKTLMVKMRELEAKWGKDAPLLVFSDSKVTDENLEVMDDSLFHRIKVNPLHNLPRQLVLQNTAYGNTMLFNAALRRLVNPIPRKAVMHDHWTMLVASVFGHIGYVDQPLVLYRQHSHNIFGGADVGLRYFLRKAQVGRTELRRRFYANIQQLEAFVERFGGKSPKAYRALVGLGHRSFFARILTLLRYGVLKQGLLRNLGLFTVA